MTYKAPVKAKMEGVKQKNWIEALKQYSIRYFNNNNNDTDEPILCKPSNCKKFVQANLLLFKYLCNIDTKREGIEEGRHFGVIWIMVNSFGFKSILFDTRHRLKMAIILTQGVPQGKQSVFQPANLNPKK